MMAFTAEPTGSEPGVDSPAPLVDAENHLRLSGIDPRFGLGSLAAMFGSCLPFDAPGAPEGEGRLPTRGPICPSGA